jgi:hypothetical protein
VIFAFLRQVLALLPNNKTPYLPMFPTTLIKNKSCILSNGRFLFIFLFLLLTTPFVGHAQVGIYNTTPVNKLDVQGDTASPATSGTAANSIVRFRRESGIFQVMDFGISKDDYGWLQYRKSDGYTSRVSSLRLWLLINPNGGNVGIGYAGTQSSNMPNEKLSINGGLIATGRIISPVAGQLLSVTALTEANLALTASRFFSSSSLSPTTEVQLASYAYTPYSSSSKWIIEFDADALINGSSADEFETYIYVGNTLVQTVRARFDASNGGGGRGNGIFPIVDLRVLVDALHDLARASRPLASCWRLCMNFADD